MFENVQLLSHWHSKFEKSANMTPQTYFAKNQYGYQK
jgi:hypothetical protein